MELWEYGVLLVLSVITAGPVAAAALPLLPETLWTLWRAHNSTLTQQQLRRAYLGYQVAGCSGWFLVMFVAFITYGCVDKLLSGDRRLDLRIMVGILAGVTAITLASLMLVRAHQLLPLANGLREDVLIEQARSDPRPPILILRSFTKSAYTSEPRPIAIDWSCDGYPVTTIADGPLVVDDLAEATVDLGLLMAVGGNDHRSVHKQYLTLEVADSQWLSAFEAIALASQAIFLLPQTTPGLTKEVQAVVNCDLMSKLLVFMPSTPTDDPWGLFEGKYNYASEWQQVRELWHRRGFRLPEYDSKGMVYSPRPDLSVKRGFYLNGEWNNYVLREAILATLPVPYLKVASVSQLMRDLAAASVIG
jgi:hypothetical protein